MKKLWIKAALIRAAKTTAQAAVAMIGTGAIGILDVDWMQVLSVSATAGILSILTSIAGLPEVDDDWNDGWEEYVASEPIEDVEEEEDE